MTHPAESGFSAAPFTIEVPDEVLADLRARIRATRWPDPAPSAAWEQGTDLGYLRRLLGHWTPMPRGGHFAPAEQPELLARDIAAFFGEP